MKRTAEEYHAYLLRVWRDRPPSQWRASLQAAGSATVHLFADLKALIAFIERETGKKLCGDDPPATDPNSTRLDQN